MRLQQAQQGLLCGLQLAPGDLGIGQAVEGEAPLVLRWPRRDLLELQHRRADGGGVEVRHHVERAVEGGILPLRPLRITPRFPTFASKVQGERVEAM